MSCGMSDHIHGVYVMFMVESLVINTYRLCFYTICHMCLDACTVRDAKRVCELQVASVLCSRFGVGAGHLRLYLCYGAVRS